MIQEELVTLETAKLLKEKGFREDCMAFYTKDVLFKCNAYINTNVLKLPAPTQSIAQKWLRETKNIHVLSIPRIIESYNKIGEVVKTIVEFYYWEIYVVGSSHKYIAQNCLSNQFNTYEEALEAGLQEALKLI